MAQVFTGKLHSVTINWKNRFMLTQIYLAAFYKNNSAFSEYSGSQGGMVLDKAWRGDWGRGRGGAGWRRVHKRGFECMSRRHCLLVAGILALALLPLFAVGSMTGCVAVTLGLSPATWLGAGMDTHTGKLGPGWVCSLWWGVPTTPAVLNDSVFIRNSTRGGASWSWWEVSLGKQSQAVTYQRRKLQLPGETGIWRTETSYAAV